MRAEGAAGCVDEVAVRIGTAIKRGNDMSAVVHDGGHEIGVGNYVELGEVEEDREKVDVVDKDPLM
jgi:hypothetical protein